MSLVVLDEVTLFFADRMIFDASLACASATATGSA